MSKLLLKSNTIEVQFYLLGISLWMPGIAVFSIDGLWGMQLAAILLILLFVNLSIASISNRISLNSINTYKEWITSHGLFFVSIAFSTIFSKVGVDKSAKTFAVEIIGMIFSMSTTWWLCKDRENFLSFINGFKLAGLISSVYSMYQLIGLRIGLPFSYIAMNNASFSIVDSDYTREILRSCGLTPEPSILASLLWIMIGITTADLLTIGNVKSYSIFSCVLLGLVSTSSQSIGLIPVYLLATIIINKKISVAPRKFNLRDIVGLFVIVIPLMYLLLSNESILFWLTRIASPDSENTSAVMRSNEILVGLTMFADSPISGLGLGAITDMMDGFASKANVSGYTSGITNGFIRVIAEQGLLGLISTFVSFLCIIPPKSKRIKLSYVSSSTLSYQISFIISGVISLGLFVGYRNLYHLWLILPIGLAMKSYLKTLSLSKSENITS